MKEERLGVGVGAWGHEILLGPQEPLQASGSEVVDLTAAGRSVADV